MRFLVSSVLILLIGLFFNLAMLRASESGGRGEVTPVDPMPVTVVEARGAGDADVIVAAGTLVLKRETQLSFKVSGVVALLAVHAGDTVQADQVLASLDQTEVSAREREARAQLELAQKEYGRSTELFSRGFVAARRVDDAKAALERAKASFDVVHFDRRWSELRPPWDGVVLSRSAEVGEMVAPGRAILAVGDTTGGFNLMAPIADRDVGRVTVGDRAEAKFSASETSVAGRVARLTAKADSRTGSFEAEIALDRAPATLRSGMIGEASIFPSVFPSVGGTSAMLAIPAEAIVEGDGERATVFVLKADGKSAQLREVTVMRLEGSQALLRAGLSAGERVVVSGAAYIRAGDPLQVVASQSAELRRERRQ